jgi:hypothetical protein
MNFASFAEERRYTRARLERLERAIKDALQWMDNYDGQTDAHAPLHEKLTNALTPDE